MAARGDLDPTFGIGGVVQLHPQASGAFNDVLVQPDGKSVAVGSSDQGQRRWVVARFNEDGSPDASFATGGMLLLEPGGPTTNAAALGVALTSNGSIVVVGSVDAATYSSALVRLSPQGNLDASFGTNGVVALGSPVGASGFNATGLAVAADDRILVVGETVALLDPYGSNLTLTVARRLTNGQPDPTFDGDGYYVHPRSVLTFYIMRALAIETSGDAIIFAGSRTTRSVASTFPVVGKLLQNGTLDTSFGENGVANVGFGWFTDNNIAAVAFQPDGRIVIAGLAWYPPGQFNHVSRLLANGVRDSSFVAPTYPSTGVVFLQGYALGVAVGNVGHVVSVGVSTSGASARGLLPNGAVDPEFGAAGAVILPFGADGSARAITAQADGKFLVAGTGTVGQTGTSMFLARLRGTAVIPAEFQSTPTPGSLISGTGAPGETIALAPITLVNAGGDSLVINACTTSAGFAVTSPTLPITVVAGTPQQLSLSCVIPLTPFTTRNGTLTCSGINDSDETSVTYDLSCVSGAGQPTPTMIPSATPMTLTLIAFGLALIGWRRFSTRARRSI